MSTLITRRGGGGDARCVIVCSALEATLRRVCPGGGCESGASHPPLSVLVAVPSGTARLAVRLGGEDKVVDVEDVRRRVARMVLTALRQRWRGVNLSRRPDPMSISGRGEPVGDSHCGGLVWLGRSWRATYGILEGLFSGRPESGIVVEKVLDEVLGWVGVRSGDVGVQGTYLIGRCGPRMSGGILCERAWFLRQVQLG